MVLEEIFILTHHGDFDASYIESIPVYKRRFHLNLLKEEVDQMKRDQEKSRTYVNRVSGVRK